VGLQVFQRVLPGAGKRDSVAVVLEDDGEPFASRVVVLDDKNGFGVQRATPFPIDWTEGSAARFTFSILRAICLMSMLPEGVCSS
jgi:hypothetical protein